MAEQLPTGFTLDNNPQALPEGFTIDKPEEDKGFIQSVSDAFTGEPSMTQQMESLSEIGSAPELNQLSVPAFKASLGLLSTGDTDSLRGILKNQFGDQVSFTKDEKGNSIVTLPSGQYALNKPGLSGQDVVRTAFDMLAFTPAGRAATIPQAAARSGAAELAVESTEEALGGDEVQVSDVASASALGGFFKGLEDVVGAGYRAFKGKPSGAGADLVEEGADTGITVMTSDVSQPQTFAGKMAQQTAEKIPVAGTGALREINPEKAPVLS